MRSSPAASVPRAVILVVGISSSACGQQAPPPAVEPPPPVNSVAPSAPPPITSAADTTELTLQCDQSIDGLEQPPATYTPVRDVVALGAVGEAAEPLQAIKQKSGLLFAKSGLLVRTNATFELVVPQGSSLRLVWGKHHDPVARVRVVDCKGPRPWLAFAGGFWARETGCMDLVVREGDRESVVKIAIGASCAGGRRP